MTTGQRIKAMRKKVGLTQKELGDKLGLSFQAVAQWENDLRTPKQQSLIKIAKALGIHLKDLIDTSIWEEFDRQDPHLAEEVKQLGEKEQAASSFFEPYGFTVKYGAIKYHLENEDDPESREVVADKWGWILSKDGSSAIFTEEELAELQREAKAKTQEAIESKFYKKVIQQQKKK